MKPTIGIIGGCGPLATVDIENKILKATGNLLGPLIDQHYFNMFVFNYTQFSDRNDAISINDSSLSNHFLHYAKLLESIGANLLLIACQTAHVYLPRIKPFLKLPIVDIVEETVGFIGKSFPHINRVGLLSTEVTQKKQLYQNALASYNIEVVSISSEIQRKIMEAIYIIKSGVNLSNANDKLIINNSHYDITNGIKYPEIKSHPIRRILLNKSVPNPLITILEAIQYLEKQGCEHVILGCTELPLILSYLEEENCHAQLIDPNTIVAESAVLLAHKLENRINLDIKVTANDSNKLFVNEELQICVE